MSWRFQPCRRQPETGHGLKRLSKCQAGRPPKVMRANRSRLLPTLTQAPENFLSKRDVPDEALHYNGPFVHGPVMATVMPGV
jgi:hypothetical protein